MPPSNEADESAATFVIYPLELPLPRFDAGDVVFFAGMILRVETWFAQGMWSVGPAVPGGAVVQRHYMVYRCVVQRGSVSQGFPIRPGTVQDLAVAAVDAEAVPHELQGDPVTADDAQNILDRHRAWLAEFPAGPSDSSSRSSEWPSPHS